MSYFDCYGSLANKKFHDLFGGPPKPEAKDKKEVDLASSIQKVTEEIIIKLLRNYY